MGRALPLLVASGVLWVGVPAWADEPPAAPGIDIQLIPGAIGVTATGDGATELAVGPDEEHLVDQGPLTAGDQHWVEHRTPGATYVVSVQSAGGVAQSTVVMPTDMLVYDTFGDVGGVSQVPQVLAQGGEVDGQLYRHNYAPRGICAAESPAISPDRRQIAYSYEVCSGSSHPWFLVTEDLRTGVRTEVLTGFNINDNGSPFQQPAWSPDGHQLAYLSRSNGLTDQLWTVSLTSGASVAYRVGNHFSRPVWRPDGAGIIAGEAGWWIDPNDLGSTALVSVPLDGDPATQIAGGRPGFMPTLSPDGSTLMFTLTEPYTLPDQLRGFLSAGTATIPIAGGTPTVLSSVPSTAEVAWTGDGEAYYYVTVAGSERHIWRQPINPSNAPTEVDVPDQLNAEWPASWSLDDVPPVVDVKVPAYVPAVPSLTFTAHDPNSLVGSLTYACSLDGASAVPCTSPFAPGTLAAGRHQLSVVATDPSGNASPEATDAFVVDTSEPSRPAITASGLRDVVHGITARRPVGLRLASTDHGSGVSHYEVRRETAESGSPARAFGGWSSVGASLSLDVASGHSTCVQARAVDSVGNVSTVSSIKCYISPYDDRSLRSRGWKRASSTTAIGGTVSVATARGATLTRAGFRGRYVYLVARVGTDAGVLRVSVGQTGRVVSLDYRSRRGYVLLAVDLGATLSGTLTIDKLWKSGVAAVDAIGWR